MAIVRKVLGWVVTIAFFVWLLNNIDQAIDIISAAVMFVVGIFEKIADAVANGIDEADSATAIHLLNTTLHTVAQLVSTVLGG